LAFFWLFQNGITGSKMKRLVQREIRTVFWATRTTAGVSAGAYISFRGAVAENLSDGEAR
jgi:hypothetical protein